MGCRPLPSPARVKRSALRALVDSVSTPHNNAFEPPRFSNISLSGPEFDGYVAAVIDICFEAH